MTVIRYAGFDPDEEDFAGCELAPLHEQDARRPRTSIDIDRAWHLKRLGRSWNEVGRLLAIEIGRPVAFTGGAVRSAALYAERIVKP